MVKFSLISMVKIMRNLRKQVRLLELLYLRRLLIHTNIGVRHVSTLKIAEKKSNIQMVQELNMMEILIKKEISIFH